MHASMVYTMTGKTGTHLVENLSLTPSGTVAYSFTAAPDVSTGNRCGVSEWSVVPVYLGLMPTVFSHSLLNKIKRQIRQGDNGCCTKNKTRTIYNSSLYFEKIGYVVK